MYKRYYHKPSFVNCVSTPYVADKELEEKFVELSAPVIGSERANALLERLWNIEDVAVLDLGLERLGRAGR